MKVELTMRKHAPIITALIFTSRSMGNWIPKLSESVNASLRSPVHCLLIFPILLTSSIVKICGKSCIRKQIVHMCCISVKVIPWTCLVLLEQDHRTAHNSILFFARCHWNLRFVRSIMSSKQLGDGNIMLQLPFLWIWPKACITDPNPLHSSI